MKYSGQSGFSMQMKLINYLEFKICRRFAKTLCSVFTVDLRAVELPEAERAAQRGGVLRDTPVALVPHSGLPGGDRPTPALLPARLHPRRQETPSPAPEHGVDPDRVQVRVAQSHAQVSPHRALQNL